MCIIQRAVYLRSEVKTPINTHTMHMHMQATCFQTQPCYIYSTRLLIVFWNVSPWNFKCNLCVLYSMIISTSLFLPKQWLMWFRSLPSAQSKIRCTEIHHFDTMCHYIQELTFKNQIPIKFQVIIKSTSILIIAWKNKDHLKVYLQQKRLGFIFSLLYTLKFPYWALGPQLIQYLNI